MWSQEKKCMWTWWHGDRDGNASGRTCKCTKDTFDSSDTNCSKYGSGVARSYQDIINSSSDDELNLVCSKAIRNAKIKNAQTKKMARLLMNHSLL